MENYMSNQLNGNACVDVLKVVNNSESDLIVSRQPKLHRYASSMRALNKVRKSCFGQDLVDSYEDNVAHFKDEYVKAGMCITMKAHIILNMLLTSVRSMERAWDIIPNKPGKYVIS